MTLKSLFAAILLFATVPATAAQAQDASVIDPAERAKIESVLVEYLTENPEIVMLAIRELQRRQTVAQMLPSIEMYRGYLEKDAETPVLGNPNGDVTIVEFFDYRCSFCRRHFPDVMRLVAEDGNIRLIPRQFPVLDRPGEAEISRIAARAALAAHKQGKFAAFHAAAMTSTGGLNEDRIYEIAAQVGLDVPRLKADMNDKLLDKRISNTLAIGQDIGFTGTPGYIIGKDVVLGAEGFDRLKEAVGRARAQMADASRAQ